VSARPKLVVGLGNPGREYDGTRHNVGFAALDRLADKLGCSFRSKSRFTAQVAEAGAGDAGKVTLAKPQTFMNASGQSVKGLAVKYEVGEQDLILVYDELDLPWGSLRIRPNGSAGGHRGVKSVIGSLGSQGFPRVRLGIHGGRREGDAINIVLAEMKRAQKEELDELLDYASRAVESIITEGVEKSMAVFNRRAGGSEEEE